MAIRSGVSRWLAAWWLVAGGLLVSLLSPAARAAETRLAYRAPAGCSEEAAFVAAVEARGASLVAAPGGEERLLSVEIEPADSGYTGTFRVQRGSESSDERRVHAATCAAVSDALAVVTAIALQAYSESSSVATAPGAPAAAAPAAAAPLAEPADAAAPAGRPLIRIVRGGESLPVDAGDLKFGAQLRYTLSGGVALGLVPNVTLPRLDLSASSASLVTAPGDRDLLLGGALRVRWSFLGVGEHRAPGFTTRIWGLKAGIGNCVPLLFDPEGLMLNACSEFAAGMMFLDTRENAGAFKREKEVGFGTAGIELDAQYNLGSSFDAGLRAGGEMWLGRFSAERSDGSQLFRSSMFNGYVSVGIGIRF